MIRPSASIVALAVFTAGASTAVGLAAYQDQPVPIVADEFSFDPDTFAVAAGSAVTVELSNVGNAPHDITFVLDAGRVEQSDRIRNGETTSLSFTAPVEPGSYEFYCSVGDHKDQGMFGVLTVTRQAEPVPIVADEFSFDPSTFAVPSGSAVSVELSNVGNAPHDIVFVLDSGRVEQSNRIRNGETTTLSFTAPVPPGAYEYYCSVGDHKEQGMVGTLTVRPRIEMVPGEFLSPRGLSVDGDMLYVAEGGTGEPAAGEFGPGNNDGRVTRLSLADPTDRTVIVDNLTNAVDPGGGVIGANHALPGGPDVTFVLLSGGPGHPEPKAQLLAVTPAGAMVAADLWAFEETNNPDGGPVDSNPWRLLLDGSATYVSDAGGNTVVRYDLTGCSTGCLYALLEPVGEDDQGEPISAVPTGLTLGPDGAMYVSLLASFAEGEAQVRRLEDMNGDGDALDPGENTAFADGLTMAVDLAFDPDGRLWVLEFGGFAAIGRLVEITEEGTGVAIGPLNAPSALAFTDDGDALVATGLEDSGFTTSVVVAIPAIQLQPGAPGPTPTPTEPVTPTPEDNFIYLPTADKGHIR
jgi:plastocyanin